MYGLIGKMTATTGQRDALIAILLEGVSDMPGCLSYIVAKDPADSNAIWITEAWDSKESHKASLAIVGGKERLRVKVIQNGKRETYMLLDPPASTPRYAERQQVEVLSWPVTNSLGQRFDRTVVYAARNYWLWPAAAAALSSLALAVGSIGVIRLRRAQQP